MNICGRLTAQLLGDVAKAFMDDALPYQLTLLVS